MSHPQILIPFGLPPAEHAKDLIKMLASVCSNNGLATLISRPFALSRQHFDDFSAVLPHEAWYHQYLAEHQQTTPLQQRAETLSVVLEPGYWFILNPVHLHIASNHLVLTDQRQLLLSPGEALQLFDTARQRCDENGFKLIYGNDSTWFLHADAWSDFVTSTPDAACGHNIDIWLPKGQHAKGWRKLQNDIQMEWFILPLQEQRELQGLKPINGLWLWAGTALPNGFQPTASIKKVPGSLQELIESPQLVLVDQLCSAALANDWGTWANQMINLEQEWFVPLLTVLKGRQLRHCELLLTNSNQCVQLQLSSTALLKFWHKPTLTRLIPA